MSNYIEKQLPFPNKKRANFISSIIAGHIKEKLHKEYNIIDIGCGTGELFSIPLALRLRKFENVKILGIDIDDPSIERAKEHVNKLSLNNLKFEYKSIKKINNLYDCVCLMAVLEHLSDPDNMLIEIKKRLKPEGIFIMYIPNGYGSYEVESFLMRKFRKSGLLRIFKPIHTFLRKVKYGLFKESGRRDRNAFIIKETLNDANNIHIQFFKLKEIKKKFINYGFLINDIFKTRFLGGPISNFFILRFKFLENLDHKVASIIPAAVASDWTFICTHIKMKQEGRSEF